TPLHVRLSLSVRAKNLLVEEHPLAENCLTRQKDRWILDTDVYNYAGVCRFYVGLASDIQILDSPAFESYVADYVARNLSRAN
ncbi:MAG: transcriptional regulator, partial [Bacteroidales bacterium]|nr:transcriptional regulator [Bacteroidales bacterium]